MERRKESIIPAVVFLLTLSSFYLGRTVASADLLPNRPLTVTNGGIVGQFITIKAGAFQMRSPYVVRGKHFEDIQSVILTKDFEIGQTEVTQAQWSLVMGYNPSYFRNKANCPADYVESNGVAQCPNHPVETVSWNDMQEFIKKLNEGNDGYSYRLPTEAEWEYAARAGTQTKYSFGDDADLLRFYGWYDGNSGWQTHAVRSKFMNQYGLYGIYGNVSELVQDWYVSGYPTGIQIDPVGPAMGNYRITRGGSWYGSPYEARSGVRFPWSQTDRQSVVGFRIVRIPR